MGCAGSRAALYKKLSQKPEFRVWSKKFDALCIHPGEVRKLFYVFAKADFDGGGTIDLIELLTAIDLERTPFTERVFAIFDDDNSGKIDFGEFVLALWNYCTLSNVTLGMFAFDLYDRDCSGLLEDYDLEKMLHDIYGKQAASSHYAKQVLKDLGELHQAGEVDLPRFLEFTRTHHSLLFPAFQLQLSLKKALLGVSFWEKHAERRVKVSKDKYIKIKDLLALHVASKIEAMVTNVAATTEGGKIAFENAGLKNDRRRRSHTAASMAADVSHARDAMDNNYRDKLFNADTSDKHSPVQQQSSKTAATNGSHQNLRALRKSIDGESAVTQLTAMERELYSDGSDAASTNLTPAAARRKSRIHPQTSDAAGHGEHNKSMPVMKIKPAPAPAPAAEEHEVHHKRKRGTAASFIINNTDNAVSNTNSRQMDIAQQVMAFQSIAEEVVGQSGYTIVEDAVFDHKNNQKEFHTRPKPARRGSI